MTHGDRCAERRAILSAYPDPSPAGRLYRRLRLARGGYDAIESLVPRDGLVLDLGCGEGLLAQLLARRGPRRRILAVDHDPRRLERVRRSATGLAIDATCASMLDVALPPCDAVLLVDVLHYFDREAQESLIARVAAALRPCGVLVLRDPDAGLGLRMLWNRLHERLFTLLRFTRANIGAYRTSGAWAGLLTHVRLENATVHRHRFLSPYADRVVTARKPS